MTIFHQVFQLLAGIGLFLFAMNLLEDSLKNLSGRSFKLFLQRVTKNRLGAAVGGALVTAVLQSSSMVSLMVLAFVGAGVFTMKTALAVILGANLGTTLDSWLVASLGFKVKIEVAAYPSIFVGGFLLVLFGKRRMIQYTAYFLLGFGLLFIGLSFMKTAMADQVGLFDLRRHAELPGVVFLLTGFLITLLVQSSSVTMALTLSALHAGVIGFAPAAAIVLGAETGTTMKIMLAAMGGNASKKRVALGNIVYNVFITAGAFLLLDQILLLVTKVCGITDPLIGLVTFSSLINLLGVIVFLPFLTHFANFLERFFKDSDASTAVFIGQADAAEPQTALDLFGRETEYFLHDSMLFNLRQFGIDAETLFVDPVLGAIHQKRRSASQTTEEQYKFLKQLQGELQAFYLTLRGKLHDEQDSRLNQLISAVRGSMYAVKGVKDIGSNIANLSRSSKDIKFDFFMHHKKETEDLYRHLHELLSREKKTDFKELQDVFNLIQANYVSALNDFYNRAQHARLEDLDITMAINFNRELFTSNKAMLMAVKDFLLGEEEAEEFNEILVYRT